jgi:hypothetical protein
MIATTQQLLLTINKLSENHHQILGQFIHNAWNDLPYDQDKLDRSIEALQIYNVALGKLINQPEQS